MDPLLRKYYNSELQHIREMGAEFAEEYPKIAKRLGLDTFECTDPYVERLLEGFAFLAARVQLKIDAEFPNFCQHLLDIVYPHYLSSTPSMTVVEFKPKLKDESLAKGVLIPKQTSLRCLDKRGEPVNCEYRTAHPVNLYPIQLTQLEYLPTLVAVTNTGVSIGKNLNIKEVKAGLRIVLQSTVDLNFSEIQIDRLPIFLRGTGNIPYRLYQQLLANTLGITSKFSVEESTKSVYAHGRLVRGLGFNQDEAMLPFTHRSFDGYRILQEYFAFPERFLFTELSLASLISTCPAKEIELIILFNNSDPVLNGALDKTNLALFCTPAINLFPKSADFIRIDQHQNEYQVVIDKTKPKDYEVFSVTDVIGYSDGQTFKQRFLPFYGSQSSFNNQEETAFFTLRRLKRQQTTKERREGVRSSYIGSELYISLVDSQQTPFSADLSQLSVETYCTNRDLPLLVALNFGNIEGNTNKNANFSFQISAPVEAINCLAGPTRPFPAAYEGAHVWRLINHLSLNYLSLLNNSVPGVETQGAIALRELLSLYTVDGADTSIKKQIEGVVSIDSKNVVRRIDAAGPLVFGRGLEISLLFDEAAFEGSSYFLLGAVLEQFFARYVSINSFVETVIKTTDRGEVFRWPVRMGCRHTI